MIKGGQGDEHTMTIDSAFSYKIRESGDVKRVWTIQDLIFIAILLLAALVFSVAALTFVYDRLFRKEAPEIPPDALAADRLKALKLPAGDIIKTKDFCFTLSFILKDYLKSRFGMEKLEKTTREFLSELERVSALGPGEREKTGKVLGLCDLVKYSDYTSSDAELPESASLAGDIISKTAKSTVQEATAGAEGHVVNKGAMTFKDPGC